jgi:hypothetical protein
MLQEMAAMGSRLRFLLALAALAATVGGTRVALEPAAAAVSPLRDPAFLPDGKVLRAVSLGQRGLLADYYWLALVQYIGDSELARIKRWDAWYPMADLVTDLDPRFGYVYSEIGSLLSGVAGRLDESSRLLEKGLAGAPTRWQIPWNLGFNKLFYERDLEAAARYFRLAGEVGKRPHLFHLAAGILMQDQRAERYDLAIQVLEDALRQTDIPAYRLDLTDRLVRARTYRVLAQVEQAAAQYKAVHGVVPVLVEQLVSEGFLRELPADPAGGRIELDPLTGSARSSILGERQPVLHLDSP